MDRRLSRKRAEAQYSGRYRLGYEPWNHLRFGDRVRARGPICPNDITSLAYARRSRYLRVTVPGSPSAAISAAYFWGSPQPTFMADYGSQPRWPALGSVPDAGPGLACQSPERTGALSPKPHIIDPELVFRERVRCRRRSTTHSRTGGGRRYLVSLSSTRPIGPLKKWEHRTSGVTY